MGSGVIPALPYRTDDEFRAEVNRLLGVIDIRDTSRECNPGSVETSEDVSILAGTAA